MIDWLNKLCSMCKKGHYQEKSVMDDITGTLWCSKCNHKKKRYD